MTEAFTPDFKKMCQLIIFNSLGFFFLDFLIPYVASVETNAGGIALGTLFSVRTIGYFSLAPVAGALTDRVSNKLLILIGSTGRGIAYILFYFAIVFNLFSLMVFSNFLLGLLVGFYWIPLDNLISSKSHPNHRSEAFGIRSQYLGIGTTIGAFAGFSIITTVNEFGIDNPYLLYSALLLFGLTSITGGILFFFWVDEKLVLPHEDVVKDKISYLGFLRSIPNKFLIGFLLVLVAIFLSSVNGTLARPFIIVFLTKNIESDPTLASFAFAPAGIISMLLAPKLGQIADKLNTKLTIAIGAILGGLFTYLLINSTTLFQFGFILILDMTVATTTGLVLQDIISRISVENRGKVLGLQTVFGDLGAIIGPIGGGYLWERYNPQTPFIFSIIVEIALIPFYILSLTRLQPFLQRKLSM